MNDPLFLFLYHKNNLITKINYHKLCSVEKVENIQPISDQQSYLPNTFRTDKVPYLFPHFDSYWMCDGLIYHYILYNKEYILSKSAIVIVEYDTWWNYESKKWLKNALNNYDVIGAKLLDVKKNNWKFFDENKHLSFKKELIGLVPFSVICCKPEAILKTAELVKTVKEFHNIRNNEMRFATASKLSGSKVGEIGFEFKNTITWNNNHLQNLTNKEGIFHPVKSIKSLMS